MKKKSFAKWGPKRTEVSLVEMFSGLELEMKIFTNTRSK